MTKRRPPEPKPTPVPDRLALVRDHELLDLIAALDEAQDEARATLQAVGKTVDRLGKTLKRASDYLRDHRARQR
jgi:hypothetical protein